MSLEILFAMIFEMFAFSGKLFIELFPYVLLGIFVGEWLKLTSWTKLIYKSCTVYPKTAILSSVILGIVSPICTYGTVPVMITLARAGTPLAPLITFLASSSLMNPQLFILTWGGISPEMAILRLLSVLLFGILLGFLLLLFPKINFLNKQVLTNVDREDLLKDRGEGINFKKFISSLFKTTQFVSYYLVIGIMLAAVLQVFVPGEFIYNLFNPGEWFAIPLAGLLGIPLYACGGGTVPLIRTLLFEGMSYGAALAFFIVGPATRITPLMAISTIIKPNYIAVYVIILFLFSLLAGIIFNSLFYEKTIVGVL